jgi:hypothetical protein
MNEPTLARGEVLSAGARKPPGPTSADLGVDDGRVVVPPDVRNRTSTPRKNINLHCDLITIHYSRQPKPRGNTISIPPRSSKVGGLDISER